MRVKFAKTEEEVNRLLQDGWSILEILPGPLFIMKIDQEPKESVDEILSKVSWRRFSDGSGEWAYTRDREGKPIPEVQRVLELVARNSVINGMKYTVEKNGKYLVRRKA